MQNAKTVVEVVEVKENFDSLADMAQNQSRISDVLSNHARYAMRTIVGFPDSEPSKEQMAQLTEGYAKTYSESHPSITYVRTSDVLVKWDSLTPEQQSKVKEKLVIGLDFAMAMSSQKFSKLRTGKDADPALHAVMKVWRDGFSDYKSEKYKNLKAKCKELLPKKVVVRTATEDFIDRLGTWFDEMEKSCKIAVGKGDNTADLKKFLSSKSKFMSDYKK